MIGTLVEYKNDSFYGDGFYVRFFEHKKTKTIPVNTKSLSLILDKDLINKEVDFEVIGMENKNTLNGVIPSALIKINQ